MYIWKPFWLEAKFRRVLLLIFYSTNTFPSNDSSLNTSSINLIFHLHLLLLFRNLVFLLPSVLVLLLLLLSYIFPAFSFFSSSFSNQTPSAPLAILLLPFSSLYAPLIPPPPSSLLHFSILLLLLHLLLLFLFIPPSIQHPHLILLSLSFLPLLYTTSSSSTTSFSPYTSPSPSPSSSSSSSIQFNIHSFNFFLFLRQHISHQTHLIRPTPLLIPQTLSDPLPIFRSSVCSYFHLWHDFLCSICSCLASSFKLYSLLSFDRHILFLLL